MQSRVLSIHAIKPLHREPVSTATGETCALGTVEEHSIVSRLGVAVAGLLGAEPPSPVVRAGIRDTFTDTGPYEELLDRCGRSVDSIAAAAHRAIAAGEPRQSDRRKVN